MRPGPAKGLQGHRNGEGIGSGPPRTPRRVGGQPWGQAGGGCKSTAVPPEYGDGLDTPQACAHGHEVGVLRAGPGEVKAAHGRASVL